MGEAARSTVTGFGWLRMRTRRSGDGSVCGFLAQQRCGLVSFGGSGGQIAVGSKHPVTPIAERPARRRPMGIHSPARSMAGEKIIATVGRGALNRQLFPLRSGRPAARFDGRSTRRASMGYKIAVVGATGNVGREMLDILAEREFPADEVVAIASRRSVGVEASYGNKTLKVKALEHY